MEFQAFQKIPRLRRGCVITEKIDGTNAQVAFADDGTMHVGSRNRWITPDNELVRDVIGWELAPHNELAIGHHRRPSAQSRSCPTEAAQLAECDIETMARDAVAHMPAGQGRHHA